MSVEGMQPVHWTFVPGGAITAFRFVKMSAANKVIQCAGTTDKPIGVAQEAATGDGAPGGVKVCISGITKIEGDADLAAGDSIGPSADGQAAAYTVTDTTKHIVGQVMIDNAAAAGLITAVISCADSRVLA
jgi:hypothetical protein